MCWRFYITYSSILSCLVEGFWCLQREEWFFCETTATTSVLNSQNMPSETTWRFCDLCFIPDNVFARLEKKEASKTQNNQQPEVETNTLYDYLLLDEFYEGNSSISALPFRSCGYKESKLNAPLTDLDECFNNKDQNSIGVINFFSKDSADVFVRWFGRAIHEKQPKIPMLLWHLRSQNIDLTKLDSTDDVISSVRVKIGVFTYHSQGFNYFKWAFLVVIHLLLLLFATTIRRGDQNVKYIMQMEARSFKRSFHKCVGGVSLVRVPYLRVQLYQAILFFYMGLIVYTLTTFTHYVMFCFLTTAFSVAAPLACSTISFRIVVKVHAPKPYWPPGKKIAVLFLPGLLVGLLLVILFQVFRQNLWAAIPWNFLSFIICLAILVHTDFASFRSILLMSSLTFAAQLATHFVLFLDHNGVLASLAVMHTTLSSTPDYLLTNSRCQYRVGQQTVALDESFSPPDPLFNPFSFHFGWTFSSELSLCIIPITYTTPLWLPLIRCFVAIYCMDYNNLRSSRKKRFFAPVITFLLVSGTLLELLAVDIIMEGFDFGQTYFSLALMIIFALIVAAQRRELGMFFCGELPTLIGEDSRSIVTSGTTTTIELQEYKVITTTDGYYAIRTTETVSEEKESVKLSIPTDLDQPATIKRSLSEPTISQEPAKEKKVELEKEKSQKSKQIVTDQEHSYELSAGSQI